MSGKFEKPVAHLQEQLAGIRPGTVSIGFIETFRYDGREIKDIATITAVKERIHVTPFEKSKVQAIAKALEVHKLNAYALNPTTVAVSIPPISGEQKQDLARHVKKLGEEAKVAVRSIRHAARKDADERAEKAIQKETDEAVVKIEKMVKDKIASL